VDFPSLDEESRQNSATGEPKSKPAQQAREEERRRAAPLNRSVDAGTIASPLKISRRTPALRCPRPILTVCADRCGAGEVVVKQPKASPKEWAEKGENDMNASEVLFCCLLLCEAAESELCGRSDLAKWASSVLSEERNATELAAAWKPPEAKRHSLNFFGPLEYVFKKRSWPRHELDAVGLAMQAWRGEGQFV
jgi:hypothetical protein